MDIKVIAGILGIAISLGSLFVFQGQLIQRVEVLESKSVPDITPLEKELSILKSQVEDLKARNSNPLMR
jgi:hypothetical protein|tara:strand:- start:493 stop:699 length:207 start_codon:yes stop_codon:yes gene_type:complete